MADVDDWDENRVDIIGSNGNDALHYDIFDQFEIMDRTHCIMNQIDDNVYKHKGLTEKQAKKLDKAIRLLTEVYELAAKKVFKK
jgi:hypothetical protein